MLAPDSVWVFSMKVTIYWWNLLGKRCFGFGFIILGPNCKGVSPNCWWESAKNMTQDLTWLFSSLLQIQDDFEFTFNYDLESDTKKQLHFSKEETGLSLAVWLMITETSLSEEYKLLGTPLRRKSCISCWWEFAKNMTPDSMRLHPQDPKSRKFRSVLHEEGTVL